MTETLSFETLVRDRKIEPPTSRAFDAALWRAALENAGEPSQAGFIRAGLWFGDVLLGRWQALDELDLGRTSLGALTRQVVGVTNLMHLQTSAMVRKAALETAGADMALGAVAQALLGPDDASATADMIRTSAIDAMGKFASYIRTTVAPQQGGAPADVGALRAAFSIFEDIYLLEYVWGRIVWCGWRMIETEGRLRFERPRPDPMGASFVVAEYRREQLLAEFMGVYAMEWGRPGSLLFAAWQVKILRRATGLSFRAAQLPAGQGVMPPTYVLREMLKATELAPYLHAPLPLMGDETVSLDDLLQAWELLALAAEGLCGLLFRRGPGGNPSTYAPTIRLSALHALLEPLGWTIGKRRAVVRHFVFRDRAADGLWSKPFLPIGGDLVAPVLTPISCPNLLRAAELWISEAAGETLFAKRGGEAEIKLRKSLAAGLAERPWRKSATVLGVEWIPKIDRAKRDLDLILRIEGVVFIGELKLKKYPVSAAEVGRHAAEFGHAAAQLDIRLTWLSANKGELAKRTGFTGDPSTLKIEGFIISGTAFGSGTLAGGYPVIDIDALQFFFDEDEFLVTGTTSAGLSYRGVATSPRHAFPLVEMHPAASFLAYLRDPLHVRHAETALVDSKRVNTLSATGQTIEWEESRIDASHFSPVSADDLAATLANAWRSRQADARTHLRPPRILTS